MGKDRGQKHTKLPLKKKKSVLRSTCKTDFKLNGVTNNNAWLVCCRFSLGFLEHFIAKCQENEQ